MKKFILAGILAMSFSGSSLAADPCQGQPETVPNSWFVYINDNNSSSKQDILDSLKLLSTGGFEVKNIFAWDHTEDVTFTVRYDPSYYANDPARAEKVKHDVLDGLQEIEGVKLECDHFVYPTPAIGVRN